MTDRHRIPGVRAIGLDPGSKRIGVAVSDISGTIASPLSVITRTSTARTRDDIIAVVRAEEAEVVVVGLPLHMNGSMSPSAKAATRLAQELTRVLDMPVELHDERRTTAQADRDMLDAGLNAQQRRQVVDKVAAAIMLQSWLDARRNAIRNAASEAIR